jgi:hypothetical protein
LRLDMPRRLTCGCRSVMATNARAGDHALVIKFCTDKGDDGVTTIAAQLRLKMRRWLDHVGLG